jgi:ABC-type proline/glycine betaine transport system ATPase subunit
MNQGKIEQYDIPAEIRKNPAGEWVEDFLTR